MKYTITESGVKFHDETEAPAEQPITRAEVMAIIRKISDGIEALDDCECLRMGLRPCGVCGIPPINQRQIQKPMEEHDDLSTA